MFRENISHSKLRSETSSHQEDTAVDSSLEIDAENGGFEVLCSPPMVSRQEPLEAHQVDIVVPVYGAADELARCLESVLRHTCSHRVIVIVDGPQPADVERVFRSTVEPNFDRFEVVRQPARKGFVAAVNLGMALSDNDVILLNSDTLVTSGWVEKLRAAAYSAPRIATVTPMSNNATICSLPEILEENLLPAAISCDLMAEIVERVTHRTFPRLPTGVGVCMYIRREALDEVGLFDEERFGLGYGEENEFCIRASRAKFKHIADDATFVYHAGHCSFGADAVRLERRAEHTLRAIDPSYIPRVADFIKSDPLLPVRQRVTDEIDRQRWVAPPTGDDGRLSVMHIVHGWPPFAVGGTEQYAWLLAHAQVTKHRVAVFSRLAEDGRRSGDRIAYLDNGVRVRFVVNNFDQRNPVARNAMKNRVFEREMVRFLEQTRPDLVHIHHLAGHCASLMGMIERRGIPIVYQVQDWWALCARSNLWQAGDTLCPGPVPARCAGCLPMTGLRPRRLLNSALHFVRRREVARQVRKASAYILGSQAILEWYRRARILRPAAAVHVLDYGVPGGLRQQSNQADRTQPGSRLVFGFIGAMMPHKGAHVAVEAFQGIDPGAAQLRLWGDPEADSDYTARLLKGAKPGSIEFLRRFDEEKKSAIYESMDVLIVPSVGLESFGIVAREAMAAGVPVLASRRGALEELHIDGVCGATFTPGDSEELRGWVNRLIDDPSILGRWRRNLPEPTTVESHADIIDDIYHRVLEGER